MKEKIGTQDWQTVDEAKVIIAVNIKHGVTEVHSGKRHTSGIIFHNALN